MNLLIALLTSALAGWHYVRTADPMDDIVVETAASGAADAPIPPEGLLMVSCYLGTPGIAWSPPTLNSTAIEISQVRLRIDKAPPLTIPVRRTSTGMIMLVIGGAELDTLLVQMSNGTTLLLEADMLLHGTQVYEVSLAGAAAAIQQGQAQCRSER